MPISSAILTELMPKLANPDVWSAAIQKCCDQYDISTDQRLGIFLAQTMYESSYYTALAENFNYSEEGLLKTFPHYFDADSAAQYARQPQMIANRVYANKYGNGDESSGDGWTYRGQGCIMVTFKDNYQSFANASQMALDDAVAYVATTEGAMMVAGWFWSTRGLNSLADADEFTLITERINGGQNGLADRKTIWSRVQTVLLGN